MSEWFESEAFWTNYAPIMFDEARWAEAPAVAEHVKKVAGLKDGDSVLDAGCGIGRISVELAALNLDVTGVDIIQNELDCAKESAEAEGVELKLIKQDLRTFNEIEKYDCAVNLYTSFGYCDDINDDMKILENICNSVKKGGTFIFECISRETAILYFTKGEEFFRAGMNVKTYFTVEGAWEGLRSRWDLEDKDGNIISHEFVQRLYTAAFLRDKIKEFGFSQVEVFGEFDYSPYDEKARTMIIVGRK